MSHLRASVRLLRLTGHLMQGLWTLRRQTAPLTPHQRVQQVQDWSVRALELLGVGLRVQGDWPVAGPLLVVCNHISWLDILVLNAAYPCRFVSKADVRHWPLIGRLVEGAGTLFIEREKRRDAMRVVHHLAEHLRLGEVLAVFPEGTTSDGQQVLPFHANLLQAAVVTDAPVLPLGLRYQNANGGQRHDGPVYIGDTTLLASLWRTARSRDLLARVHVGQPDLAQGRDRRSWAQGLQVEVERLRES